MPGLDWLDVSNIDFKALLLLEPLHAQYIAEWEPSEALGTALNTHTCVAWYLEQIHPPIKQFVDQCLALANPNPSPKELRQAELSVLENMEDWLIYILDPGLYDRLDFLKWDDASLSDMTDFNDKIVLDIGSGTGRLAFTVAPQARTVYAIEPVANLRRFIWQKRSELGFDNVYPIDGTIIQIPLENGFADIVMAGHVFGEFIDKEYQEMRRVVKPGGMLILHPGTNANDEDKAHHFLINNGFACDTFIEPGEGLKRKYWKTIKK